MKVSDYMASFIEAQGITDVFGVPGVGCGHFMNSLYNTSVNNHLVYNEQGAAFAACGYAQATRNVGFAYSTAGPGGTNLLTGVANAYADSVPTVFMVGEKDLVSLRGDLKIRQKASQEVDITNVAKPITKWSYQIQSKEEMRYVLEKAFYLACHGRRGPILLDIPSDVMREDVNPEELKGFVPTENRVSQENLEYIISSLNNASRPLLLVGNGLKQSCLEDAISNLAIRLNIPMVSTMISFDVFFNYSNHIGYLGMEGDVAANRAVSECDLLLSLGARLNFKQVNNNRETFAKNAHVIRIDCDQDELDYRLRDEKAICAEVEAVIPALIENENKLIKHDDQWLKKYTCPETEHQRKPSPNKVGDAFMKEATKYIPEDTFITIDVGSHRRWVLSQIEPKKGQQVLQSSGLCTMGYALPAAVGAYYSNRKPVVCIDGDGGIMMNLQELQAVNAGRLPITIFVFNNNCLGDIMEFQKKIFKQYSLTTVSSGYKAANFKGIAAAFDLQYSEITNIEDFKNVNYKLGKPQLIEVRVPSNE